MKPDEKARLLDAVAFAVDAHANQTRKGRGTPYVGHPLRVAGLVLEHGGDADQAVAGLLHDTLEDCPEVDAALLRSRFGEGVTRMVAECSDLLPGDSPRHKSPWRKRKEYFLGRLGDVDKRTRLVVACDKLDNLRSLIADLECEGAVTLERFHASPRQTRWYYEQVGARLGEEIPAVVSGELRRLLRVLEAFVPEASPEQ